MAYTNLIEEKMKEIIKAVVAFGLCFGLCQTLIMPAVAVVWETYVDPEGEWSIAYPKDLLVFGGSSYARFVSFSFGYNSYEVSVSEYNTDLLEQAKKIYEFASMGEKELLDDDHFIIRGSGYECYYYASYKFVETEDSITTIYYITYLIEGENGIYNITLEKKEPLTNEVISIFTDMILSFRG